MSNILVIIMDDMRFDELKYLPNVRRLLAGKGTRFNWTRTNVSVCSPSRTGILTGQYSKHHGVVGQVNTPTSTALNNSVYVALDNAGFRNGMFGKFLTSSSPVAGFDEWFVYHSGENAPGQGPDIEPQGLALPTFNNGTTTVTMPTGIYNDHYLAKQAIEFMQGTEPWLCMYSPASPHWGTETASYNKPPNHLTEYAGKVIPLTEEADVSDKPSWIQALPALSDTHKGLLRAEEILRVRDMLGVDDAIGAMANMIQATGLADNTTIIFTSDNGVGLGEHRVHGPYPFSLAGGKNLPYDGSMRVPLIAVGPDFPRQTITGVPTTHADITATLFDIANTSPLLSDQVGFSLAAIAADPTSVTYTGRHLLHYRVTGGLPSDYFPTGDGITTATRKLWRYVGQTGNDQYEMYDLVNDPDELTNRANDLTGTWQAERTALIGALNALLA